MASMTPNLALLFNYPMPKASGMDLGKRVHGVSFSSRIIGFNDRKPKTFAARTMMQLGRMVEESKKEECLGLDVVTKTELRQKGFLGLRKTKLVCTVGPACCSYEELERLALGGMNVAMLNMCHKSNSNHAV